MLFFLTIFLVSLALMIGLFVSRFLYERLHQEHPFHKLVVSRARSADLILKRKVKKTRRMMRYINKKTLSALVHFIIEEIEERFHKLMNYVRSKFPHHRP